MFIFLFVVNLIIGVYMKILAFWSRYVKLRWEVQEILLKKIMLNPRAIAAIVFRAIQVYNKS